MSEKIAYQGIPGAYHEVACYQYNPELESVGFETFDETFAAALKGDCDYACMAVENSLAGSINATYDILSDSVLHVIGEEVVKVDHALMARANTKLSDVKRVYSHYQALAQCEKYLKENNFSAITEFDTAGSAKIIADRSNENSDEGEAAIASVRAAEIYGLDILATNIQDEPFNYTRFFILGTNEAPYDESKKYKTSLLLATRHQPGDLVRCLELFPEHNINMTKLESRPRRDKPWSYVFYIDIDGHINDDNVAAAMMGMMRRAAFVKFLGSYVAAPVPS